jgi:preprotein translocase subunit Sss1
MKQWLATNLFAFGIIIVGVIALAIYLCPDWIKRRWF